MKKIIIILTVSMVVLFQSCEFVEAPDSTLEVQTGSVTEIKYPSILLNGDNPAIFIVGDTFEEPGAVATLGTTDITEDMLITGTVDASTAGAYPLTYSVSTINTLGSESPVAVTRFVIIQNPGGLGPDLAGNYSSTSTSFGGASFGQTMAVKNLGSGYYSASDIYAHPAVDQPAFFFDLGAGEYVIQDVSGAQSIFDAPIDGVLVVVPGATIDFNINIPAFDFSTTKPWAFVN